MNKPEGGYQHATTSDLKRRTREIFDDVEFRFHPHVIFRYGRPCAKLVPLTPEEVNEENRVRRVRDKYHPGVLGNDDVSTAIIEAGAEATPKAGA